MVPGLIVHPAEAGALPCEGGIDSWNAVPSHDAVCAEANSEALHGAGVE